MLVKIMLEDLKTYYSVKVKNRIRYPYSQLDSYVPRTLKVGAKTTIKKNVSFSEVINEIDNGVYIGNNCSIFNCRYIRAYTSISYNVNIGLDNHAKFELSTSPLIGKMIKSKPTVVEADVLISANVSIMSGVCLGVGCIIGANSFVNTDIPPYAIAVGSPAKIIGYRFNESMRIELLASKWWTLDMDFVRGKYEGSNSIQEFLGSLKSADI